MTYTELAEKAGISVPFANQLLTGKRKPSRVMAYRIYDATGMKLGHLASLTPTEIERARSLDEKAAA